MSNFDNQCFILNITTSNGLWVGNNPFIEAVPLFVTQLAVILIVTRFLYHLFKPLHQPRIVSDLLGGILLGESAFMRSVHLNFFPIRNIAMVETFAYMALVLHMFLVGLELDLHAIARIRKKAMFITATGLILPFALGMGIYYLMYAFIEQHIDDEYDAKCSFLWSSIMTATCFPTVSRILSDLKLINSEIGRLAMPIALMSDVGSWVIVVILIPFSYNPANAPYVIITTIVYVLASFYSIRPFLAWMVSYTSGGNTNYYSDSYLCFALAGVASNAFLTDVTGTHPIVGAFVFGLILPTELALVLLDRFYFVISGIMLPMFFTLSGIRVDIFKITTWGLVFATVILIGALKIISFLPISRFSNINTKDKIALGLLMSSKGTLAIVIVNIGWEKKLLHEGEYAVTIIAILLMNSLVAPALATIYRRTNFFKKYKSRSLQDAKSEAELRILACIQSFCNVPGILKLLDASHGSQHNPMTVFTLHLVEFSGRTSPMLIVHDSDSPRFEDSANGHHDYDTSEADQIVTAFTNFEKQTRNVRIHSLTSVSPTMAMHGDICSLAEDKLVAFLILPFMKGETKEGNLGETLISSFRRLNQDVLREAPCSVGIFIDRGLEEARMSDFKDGIHDIAMVFLGGPDDCEALACAWRMAKKPGVKLTVKRLLESDSMDSPQGNEIDDDYINEFRIQTADEEFIVYEEKVLQDGDDLIVALKEMENKYELLIVGRRDGLESPMTTEILHRIDFPELGVIGELLAVSDSATSSVLVVQQFVVSIDSQIIEDFIGTDCSSMGRSSMHFGSRRVAKATTNKLWMYSKKENVAKLHHLYQHDEEDDKLDGRKSG